MEKSSQENDEEGKLECPHGMKELNPGADCCHGCCLGRSTIYCLMDTERTGPTIMNYGKPKEKGGENND